MLGGSWLASQPPVDWVRNAFLATEPVYAKKAVNEQTAMQTSAVYYCVGLIADVLSSLPINVFRDVPNGPSLPASTPSWLVKPNRRMSRMDFWTRVVMSLLLAGNAYIYVLRNARGDILELWPIHPSWVYPHPDPETNEILYDVNGTTLDASELLHIPALAMPGYLTGLSPLEAARQAIGVSLVTEEYGARYFAQGATMAGVIQHPGKALPDEAKRLKDEFMTRHQGVANAHAIGVLTGGASFHPVSITPEQSQFLQTRNFTKVDIALFYRIPAYMVDPSVTSSWGRGVEEQNYALSQNTYYPWAARIEQAVSTFLLPGFQVMRFDMDARLRPKTTERYQAHAVAIENGIKSPDEVRAEEGLPPLPDGQGEVWFRPVHLIGISEDLPNSEVTKMPNVVPGGQLPTVPTVDDPMAEGGAVADGGKKPEVMGG